MKIATNELDTFSNEIRYKKFRFSFQHNHCPATSTSSFIFGWMPQKT
ncbi:hypothetical protein J2851_001525 [Azospirillum rugosum]|uniref:Uncharacterized protein n=1 Tax=Azospirillum rugosum TaxID=416170 RepID=A0ABS4SGT5_9PROT|nr:hypothetical protein [Azospirillum rugosum]MDQ0524412.1 hypothetical protein [Azospirillum rugosum]